MPAQKKISVIGAKVHNLNNVSVEIPHNSLTLFTGVSGSGKSSLAFDTIYAEGQRRFVESLSAYARQFLERMSKPDVEAIHGLPPAVAIEQKPSSKNPRSTVGTTTEIYDYIRLLYGRIGQTVCKSCGETVKKDSPDSVVNELLNWNEGDKIYVLFPFQKFGETPEETVARLKENGFFRFLLLDSDEILEFSSVEDFPKQVDIYILADRLIISPDKEFVTRLTESIETAFNAGNGTIKIRNHTKQQTKNFSTRYECADCEIVYVEPEPRLFSFNNPFGACPACQGFGRTVGIDEDLVIPDDTRSLSQSAIAPFKTQGFILHQRDMLKEAAKLGISINKPIKEFHDDEVDFLWNGAGKYLGINGFFKMLEEKSYKMHYRILTSRYRGYTKCKQCGGSRIRTSARQVFVSEKSIPQLIEMPLDKLFAFFEELQLTDFELHIVSQVLFEIRRRLKMLVDIGLQYLTLSRLSHTLSGGESQRINLSTALGSALVGTLYVLDEPSIGMHPCDTLKLINILEKLRNLGNTIIVVEHDPDIMKIADYIIDIGPKAGQFGGNVCFSGTYKDLLKSEDSITAQYLSGKKQIPIPKRRQLSPHFYIHLKDARLHNVDIPDLKLPLNCLIVVTGVSGSGKSTLIHNILYAGMKRLRGGYDGLIGNYSFLSGFESIENVELIDQAPIGKSSRSTPATFTKVFDLIRDVYATTQASKQLGLKPGYFSFNVPGGRCDVCEGEGTVTVDMQFLPDIHLECEACKGTRYKKEARQILYNEKSIVDVLNMTVDQAAEFFEAKPRILAKLSILQQVGLGYLKLGQPSTMLSAGEAQRIKLASHLDGSDKNKNLLIFDEPTTGLHLDDISKLLACINSLVDRGHSVIIIEHNLNVIASADYIIDLGPEGGDSGGRIVAKGRPEQIVKFENSHTAKALAEFLNNRI